MTVSTGPGLFEDLRAAQNGPPRAARSLVILPSHVQAGKTGAMAHHGVVQVLVPKSPGPQAKRIPVRDSQLGAAVPVGVKAKGS